MSNKEFHVLWIDDEHEGEISALHRTAKDFGVKLFPYKSMNGGCSELEKNYALYDAILLDAKFFENEEDASGSEDTKWVHRTKDRILQLPKKFEFFVLTGQAKTYASEEFNNAFPLVFEKGKSNDEDELFNSLVLAASKQVDTQIRHQYQRVFNVCTEKYIGEYAGQDLLTIIKNKEENDIEHHFTTIRKIMEDVFTAFNKFQLLPREFVTRNVSLNPSSKFLSGKSQSENTDSRLKKYQHKVETHLPDQIANYFRNILSATQPGAHRSTLDDFVKKQKTPYLFNSILYQLLDVIVWFKEYVDNNPKKENWIVIEENKTRDVNNDLSISGKVINFVPAKGFAFLKPLNGGDNIFIPPHLVENHQLKEGDVLQGIPEDYIDNRTQEPRTKIIRISF
jgi:hypothetical protein